MAVKKSYRGATDVLSFTVIDCETGTGLDLTGAEVSVQFRSATKVLTFLGSGYSSGALFSGSLTIDVIADGECSIQFAESDSLTAPEGVYDAHVQVSTGTNTVIKYKYVQKEILTVEDHAIK